MVKLWNLHRHITKCKYIAYPMLDVYVYLLLTYSFQCFLFSHCILYLSLKINPATLTNKRIKQGNTRKIKIITILQLYQRESYPNICRLYINNTLVYIYIYINMNQHCWL
jgi:hypothetical protein